MFYGMRKHFVSSFVPFSESLLKKIDQRDKLTNSIQELRNPHMINFLEDYLVSNHGNHDYLGIFRPENLVKP
jgi:hypothetical protein